MGIWHLNGIDWGSRCSEAQSLVALSPQSSPLIPAAKPPQGLCLAQSFLHMYVCTTASGITVPRFDSPSSQGPKVATGVCAHRGIPRKTVWALPPPTLQVLGFFFQGHCLAIYISRGSQLFMTPSYTIVNFGVFGPNVWAK